MKIDRSKGKRSSAEVPVEAKALIDKLKECQNYEDLLQNIKEIKVWTYGKCELYHWVDVLDLFDSVLLKATAKSCTDSWILTCDEPANEKLKECVLHILRFTTMLVEHSFSRHLYNSVEHLINLLTSTDLILVLEVLHLLYMFSKRSNYLTRMTGPLRTFLNERLTYLAESWGGKEAGFGLAVCCKNLPLSSYPSSATSVHLEFTNTENSENETSGTKSTSAKSKNIDTPTILHLENVHTLGKTAGQIMDELIQTYNVPINKRLLLFIHLRLATNFPYWETRILCVQTRLQALSVLIYANGISDNIYQLLYRGFMEELVDVLELEEMRLTEIKAAALRTLTSIIHLDRAQNFPKIIDVTEVGSYHGFLPMMVRSCISALTSPTGKSAFAEQFPLPLATALFSFVYHLASYELGGEALVNCGMLESLIKVINWTTTDPEQITFVTRAVRVIDLITNIDMQAFQTHNGLTNFISRLEMEINECRKEQPFEIRHEESVSRQNSTVETDASSSENNATDATTETPMETDSAIERQEESLPGTSSELRSGTLASEYENNGLTCLPQRAALLKSMLNFLKKAIQDQAFSDSIRHVMETSLPQSLKHIISNAEYYGSSLFLLATDVVTVYVFQEPSLLSALQDSGLTDIMLDSVLVKEIPATREVISSLPNMFSALSLNSRGLDAFVKRKPFQKIFKVLVNPEYLPPMRRRRTAEPLGDTASNLGNAMDELMRHQPSLKVDATVALVELLQELCSMGRDSKYSCWRPQKSVVSSVNNTNRTGTSEGGSSDDEDDDDEENMVHPVGQENTRNNREDTTQSTSEASASSDEKPVVPLVDYIFNVMKFVDAILSNNSTDDHCREFVSRNGLQPLLEVFAIPNLPLDFPNLPACAAASSVCKSILNLAHEGKVLKEGMICLEKLLVRLDPLNSTVEAPGSSVLLRELAKAGVPSESVGNPQDTPILNAMTATHAYVMMFIHVCRTGQSDIRAMSITQWGSREGLRILKKLSKLYWNLVWESTVLLALCSGEYDPGPNEFARADLDALFPPDSKKEPEVSLKEAKEGTSNTPSSPVQTSPESNELMEIDIDPSSNDGNSQSAPTDTGLALSTKAKAETSKMQKFNNTAYAKSLKPILGASSRLGRALAELFGLLVKLCVGSPLRQRRGHHNMPTIPGFITPGACAVAKVLSELLTDGLDWEPCSTSPVPKLTFKICSVGFSAPLLFDEKKFPYYLMLKKFLDTNGLKSLFSVFYWAVDESVDPTKVFEKHLTQKQVEFLEAWLVLVEKFVNPKTLLETPHVLPAKSPGSQRAIVHFEPQKFISHIHKLAFEAVLHLWNTKALKSLGNKGVESLLGILCHILRHKPEAKTTDSDEGQSTPRPRGPSPAPFPIEPRYDFPEANIIDVNLPGIEHQLINSMNPMNNIENDTNLPTPSNNAPPSAAGSSSSALPELNELGLVLDGGDTGSNNSTAVDASNGNRPATTEDSGTANSVGTAAPPTAATAASSSSATAAAQELGVDFFQLQQLTDMGFATERCIEALMSTSNLMQATDYLLNNTRRTTRTNLPLRPSQNRNSGTSNQAVSTMDWDYNDDDQILRAIVMSLGDQSPKISNLTKSSGQVNDVMQTLEALKPEDIDSWTETILEKCIALLDDLPDTVFKICEVLVAVGHRRGKEWIESSLSILVKEIASGIELVKDVVLNSKNDSSPSQFINGHEHSYFLYIRLHLFGLMFEEAHLICATLVERMDLVKSGVKLMTDLFENMKNAKSNDLEVRTPKWLAPLILLFDLYEKSAIASKRRSDLAKETDHSWKWFDINSGKWCPYSNQNNQIIDNAFWAGEASVRITAGRRRYVINFSGMVQLNEETSNRRPITLWLKNSCSDGKSSDTNASSVANAVEGEKTVKVITERGISYPENFLFTGNLPSDKMDVDNSEPGSDKALLPILDGLTSHSMDIIVSCVGFIPLVLPETLHAIMRLLLRLTRSLKNAIIFSRLGGTQNLLNLTEESGFIGFLPLANLLIRHAVEDHNCLRFAMEKMIRGKALSTGASTCKELHYLLRVLAPIACRSPTMFKEVAKDILRVDINFVTRRGLNAEDDMRLIMKPLPCRAETFRTTMSDAARRVIEELLDALPNHQLLEEEDTGNKSSEATSKYAEMPCPVRRSTHFRRIILDDEDIPEEDSEEMETDASTKPSGDKEADKVGKKDRKKRFIIPKFAIFQLMAESVHSYSYSSKVIAEYTYQGGKHVGIHEDTTALAYLLDTALTQPANEAGVNDPTKVVLELISTMSACNHLPEVQIIVVSEIKAALHRAVALRESSAKHMKITALSNLIAQMIETCPTFPTNQMLTSKAVQLSLNPILKLVLKKGLMVDLTRVPHHLDLTSEHLCGTMNSLLSTLEIISRVVNQPVPANPNRPKPKNEANPQDSLLTQDTSNSAGTRAQGEETVEDADNTEHDISAEAESLDPTSETQQTVGGFGSREEFEEALTTIRNNILSGANANSDDPDDLIGDSQNSRMDTEQDDGNESSDSDSEASVPEDGGDEEDDDDGEEDDEDEDEDDDDDEDEDGVSNFDENDQDLLEEGFIRFPGLEREEDMLMVQYGETENTPIFFTNNGSYNFNLGLFEDPLLSENSSGLRLSHPLLSSPVNEPPATHIVTSRQRNARQRRYQYFQYINPRHPHPPAILQRLLGPSTAHEVMQLTTGQGLPSALRDTRFVVQMNDPLEISSLNMREMREGSRIESLVNFTALHWWCEEAKALDGESMHDCVVGIKREIVEAVEKDRDEIFKARQERRSKEAEENKKKKESNEKSNAFRSLFSGRMPELAMAALAVAEADAQAPRENNIEDDDDDDSESDISDLPNLEPAASDFANLRDHVLDAALSADLPGFNLVMEQENLLNEARRTILGEIQARASEEQNRPVPVQAQENSEEQSRNVDEQSVNTEQAAAPPTTTEEIVSSQQPQGETSSFNNVDAVEPARATPEELATAVANSVLDGDDAEPPPPPAEPVPGPSGLHIDDFRNILGDLEVPEGVDPSFLAALPEDMRQEVLTEHLREQRLQQRPSVPATETATVATVAPLDVSPEFLAALPPNIQEELLAHQRLEQQRRIAVSSNPNDPVDTAAFFRNLQPSLRQSILADMEDSQIAVLPPELAVEAQNLRREWETRNRQLLQDRFIHHSHGPTSATLSSILRNSGLVAGMRHMSSMSSRYALHNAMHHHGRGGGTWRGWGGTGGPGTSNNQLTGVGNANRIKGKQLVDHEALCCILIILYIEDPKINNGRLHRVLRNLSYHAGTRNWIIRALLSVLEKGNESTTTTQELPFPMPALLLTETSSEPMLTLGTPSSSSKDFSKGTTSSGRKSGSSQLQTVNPSWLNVTLESAMGCRANVFHIQKVPGSVGKKSISEQRQISIHPQAVPSMSKNTMDMLCNLAKSFPCHFLPGKQKAGVECSDTAKITNTDENKGKTSSTPSGKGKGHSDTADGFFDLLLKLDTASSGKKVKCLAKVHSSSSINQDQSVAPVSFEESHFGKLISMLGFPYICRSSLLTDKLLRILSMISIGIPETYGYGRKVVLEESETGDCFHVPESHLRLIVEVITSKSCSEDGLDEATSLLLNLSYGPPTTRDKILKLLNEGVRKLGNVVCDHIASLMSELRAMNKDSKTDSKEGSEETSSTSTELEAAERRIKGVVQDRFTKESVIITSKSKAKPSSELQLPTMLSLTSKSSSQAFFLRLLKVIMNLREAIRVAIKKHKQKDAAVPALGGPIMSSTGINGGTNEGTAETTTTGTNTNREDQPMDIDQDNMDTSEPASNPPEGEPSSSKPKEKNENDVKVENKLTVDVNQLLPRLSSVLELDMLWQTLSECLLELGHTPDHHAVLVLQPAVEAFFLVHASTIEKEDKKMNLRETREAQLAHLHQDLPPVSPIAAGDLSNADTEMVSDPLKSDPSVSSLETLNTDAKNFVKFAETHRTVLNQILRQSTAHLADGPFAVLVDHTRVLDFDIKRRYFRTELERLDEGVRREDLAVHVRRSHVFEDSFRELQRRSSEDWKNRFYIVFEGEEGQDAGGLLREWYMIISREIFNPMYALFTISPGDRVTYMINPSSHCNPNHLFYFKFVGRVIAKAIYDNKLLECYFTRSFYKHILGKYVKHIDMESEDYSFYQGLAFLMDNHVSELGYDLTFSTEVQEFGVTEVRDLIPNGRNIAVTEENKMEYIRLVCQMKMTGAIRKQLNAFLEGFYDIIPKRLISIFSEQELELLVSGLPNIDIEDLKANTEYHKYQPTSLQIQWFWRALRSFDQADRAKFLQFVTGTSKVPLQGFGSLEGMNGVQKFQIHRDDRSTDRLPSAHTCFNQLDLPAYETYDKLRSYLLKAVHECSEGFGFA